MNMAKIHQNPASPSFTKLPGFAEVLKSLSQGFCPTRQCRRGELWIGRGNIGGCQQQVGFIQEANSWS